MHREYQKLIDLKIDDNHPSTQISDIPNPLYFSAHPLSQEEPTRHCQPYDAHSLDCNALLTTANNTQKPYSPVLSGSICHRADHSSQLSGVIAQQSQDGETDLHGSPTMLCHPYAHSQDYNARLTTVNNTQKPYSPVQCVSNHFSAVHSYQPSSDLVEQSHDGETELLLPDQCLSMERSRACSSCVIPTIPSATQNCTPSVSTPANTFVTDVQQNSSDTTVHLVSLECQNVPSLGQAHGSPSGGG